MFASPVRRTLGVNVGVDPSYSQPLNNMAWNYIWAKATGSTCDMTIGQSVNVATPLYVEGNLCLQNSATIASTVEMPSVSGRTKPRWQRRRRRVRERI